MDKTREILKGMLAENTGAHFLDSGGAYGRNWERNQGRDFDSEPATFLRFNLREDGDWDVDATLNVYHWLADRLEYDEDMQARFDTFAETMPDDPWLCVMEEFTDSLEDLKHPFDGEGALTVNSYNGEDMLSQVIQYTMFRLDDVDYVLLQIHGGCDVRGGYTAPKAFTVEDEAYRMLDNDRATLSAYTPDEELQPILEGVEPKVTRMLWDTDNGGCTWYDAEGMGSASLEDYLGTDNPELRGKGYVYIDESGNGYCPITGGKLELHYY